MSTNQGAPTRAVVFDLASLRFRFGPGRRSVAVLSAAGEHLNSVTASPSDDASEVAFRALVRAMATSRVLRVGADGSAVSCACAFYNPFTAQVSYVDADGQAVFACAEPQPVSVAGDLVIIEGLPGQRTMAGEGFLAQERSLDAFQTARTLAAYA